MLSLGMMTGNLTAPLFWPKEQPTPFSELPISARLQQKVDLLIKFGSTASRVDDLHLLFDEACRVAVELVDALSAEITIRYASSQGVDIPVDTRYANSDVVQITVENAPQRTCGYRSSSAFGRSGATSRRTSTRHTLKDAAREVKVPIPTDIFAAAGCLRVYVPERGELATPNVWLLTLLMQSLSSALIRVRLSAICRQREATSGSQDGTLSEAPQHDLPWSDIAEG